MTQFDAAATPMWRCFSSNVDSTPFKASASNINLDDKNIVLNKWQKISETFNLASEDANPDLEFNIVLWHAVKGDAIPFPGPKRAAFVQVKKEDDE